MAKKASVPVHRVFIAHDLYSAIQAEAGKDDRSVPWLIDRVLRERFLSETQKGRSV